MKIQNLFTSGKMNKDLDERLVPQGEYRDALNVKVANSNGSDVGAIENDLSNEVLTSLDFGTNPVCIGAVADDKNRKIYWFVKSETGSYIAEYSEFLNTSSFLLKDTRAFNNNVLNFKKHKPITGVNVLINDDESKVFIYWTDGENPPRYLEVSEAKQYLENGFEEVDLSVIKAAPRKEPNISLSNDDDLDDNYIEEKFFTFAYRYKYKHNKYSVLSPFSEVAFSPKKDTFNEAPYDVYAMTNKYNSINVSYNSGSEKVLEVEVYAKEEGSSNVYLIGKFNKQTEGMTDNANYTVKFQNNKIYRVLDPTQFNRVYDNVPLKAFAQDFIGNRLVYANYEENYNITEKLDINLEIQSTETTSDCPTETLYSLYNNTASDVEYLYLLCGETDYRTGVAKPGQNYICALTVQNSLGLIVASVRSCAGNTPEKTLKSNRNYIVGLVYFDSEGRKSSVITRNNTSINVPIYSSELSNKLKVTINNNPPQWADRYKIAIKEVKRDYVVLKTRGKIHTETGTNGKVSIYVRIDEEEKNKVPDGSNLILKSYDGTIYNSVEIYNVESVASYDDDYLTSLPSGAFKAGLYMKLSGEGSLETLAGNNAYAYTVFEVISDKEEDSVFYEVPGTYDIIDGYHSGTFQNQSETNPAIIISQAFNAFTFGNGVESNRIKDSIVEETFNIGVRVNEQLENYKRNKRIASLTYSDVYEETTSYNGLNVFNLSQANYKDIDEKYGAITKIHSRDNDLIVFQENKIHNILFNKNVLYTASGDGSVSQTLNVLGQEVPYTGEYGISGSPESFQSWGSRMYFTDERRSAVLRLSQDGISEISDYGMRSWFNDNLNKNLNIRGIGGYDPLNDQYVLSIQDKPVEWKEETYKCVDYQWLPDEYVCDSGPSLVITGSTSALVGSTVTLTANASDPDGYITKYVWSTGGNNSTENVTNGTSGNVSYTAKAYDQYGFFASDDHTINWYTTTTTTTQPPGPTTTTTTTEAPCTDCGTVINNISDFSAAVGGSSGNIPITGSNINSAYFIYTWQPNLVSVSLNGNSIDWSTNNNNECGTAQVRVCVDSSGGAGCCGDCEDFFITVTGCVGTTTTTTQAPATTTTTTTQAPATTTTTTTQAPVTSYFYLKYCSNDQDVYCGGVRQTLSDNTSTWSIGNSFFNTCVNECTYLSSSAPTGSGGGNVDGSTVTRNNSCATCF
jgi:hypothetical protein